MVCELPNKRIASKQLVQLVVVVAFLLLPRLHCHYQSDVVVVVLFVVEYDISAKSSCAVVLVDVVTISLSIIHNTYVVYKLLLLLFLLLKMIFCGRVQNDRC